MTLPRLGRFAVDLVHGVAFALIALSQAAAADEPTPALIVLDRSIVQDRGQWQCWRIDYRLRNNDKMPLVLHAAALSAKVEGWVSNSRVASHAMPRRSSVQVTGTGGLSAYSEVLASADEDQRCREHAILQVWSGTAGDEPPDPVAKAGVRPIPPEVQPVVTIPSGGVVHVRLQLEHVHFLYGPHDPLLGPRNLELHLGSAVIRDVLPLDRERRAISMCSKEFPQPPVDRLDRHVYFSPPDSLHLEAHVPGNQSYRFERSIRYGTRMRLRYWYLIAPGTEGDCRAQVRQFKDASIWRELAEGSHEQTLSVVGRWTRVERIFRTETEATTLALEFRILGSGDVGEMWVDDITLDVIGDGPKGP